ncbi:Oidioi.mRNA.OKI2018_I69.PAR.g12735.t1.cds [Oikopleura dioica]|uniref:Oidioi.mRNA.OKI2018_I69.PAR.g12735.t1.cds n=1 Tax=Oikopleura dioica TaxID=34765 RepID=A0ABN7S7R0_OIKDI|nr:Oidioi.mRNA.OKI2018_I69.PAR.g12735.t1.cds [Oikopleura dioica]
MSSSDQIVPRFTTFDEEDYQPFISTQDHLAPGEEEYDIKNEFLFDESFPAEYDPQDNNANESLESVEFNSFEVIEPDMPPFATSSPRKAPMESPPASPSTYASSSVSFEWPNSPLTPPYTVIGENIPQVEENQQGRKRKSEDNENTAVKKAKRSLF